MSGPSEKALLAGSMVEWDGARAVLDVAHDPRLGLDRSVCLRDVTNAIVEWQARLDAGTAGPLLDFLEREFGGGT